MAGDALRREPQEEVRVHGGRFAVAYLALAIVAGAAVGGAFLLAGRPAAEAEPAWAEWAPRGERGERATQIADYVGRRYRTPDGKQLAVVLTGPPKVEDYDVRWLAIRRTPAGTDDDVRVLPADRALVYQLCGLGENCALEADAPGEELVQLLRREALELALFTFKHVDDAETVFAMLPTGVSGEEGTAVFFRRADLKAALDRPLESTLARADPPRGAVVDPTEALTIERLTGRRLFSYQYRQAQDGNAVILFVPLALARS